MPKDIWANFFGKIIKNSFVSGYADMSIWKDRQPLTILP